MKGENLFFLASGGAVIVFGHIFAWTPKTSVLNRCLQVVSPVLASLDAGDVENSSSPAEISARTCKDFNSEKIYSFFVNNCMTLN